MTMTMHINNVRCALDLSLDEANLLLLMLRSYQTLKVERAEELREGAPQHEAEMAGAADAMRIANRVEYLIDTRVDEVERSIQSYVNRGLPDVGYLEQRIANLTWTQDDPAELKRMEDRFKAAEAEAMRLDAKGRSPAASAFYGWDTVEGGAAPGDDRA